MAGLLHAVGWLCFANFLMILAATRGAIHEVYGALILLCAGVFWIGGLFVTRADRIVELLEGETESARPVAPPSPRPEPRPWTPPRGAVSIDGAPIFRDHPEDKRPEVVPKKLIW